MSIKIAMIGDTNIGKTSYLIGTSQSMLSGVKAGVKGCSEGFKFHSHDLDQATTLTAVWNQFLATHKWRMGNANNEIEKYQFRCTLDDKDFPNSWDCDFTLIDYRGGLLTDKESDKKNDLIKYCSGSDAIIIALSAEVLIAAVANGGQHACFNYYQNTLQAIVNARFNEYTFIFLITKSDFFRDKTKTIKHDIYKEGVKLIYRHFGSYLTKSRASMIVQVSMGNDLGGEFAQGGTFTGHIEPRNVHLPILFAFFAKEHSKHTSPVRTGISLVFPVPFFSYIFREDTYDNIESVILEEIGTEAIVYYNGTPIGKTNELLSELGPLRFESNDTLIKEAGILLSQIEANKRLSDDQTKTVAPVEQEIEK